MLDLLFVGLFQAIAGEPAETPEQTQSQPAAEAPPSQERQSQVRRCRIESVTASRVRRQRICTTEDEDEAIAQRAYDWMRQSDNAGGPGLSQPSTRGSSGSGGGG